MKKKITLPLAALLLAAAAALIAVPRLRSQSLSLKELTSYPPENTQGVLVILVMKDPSGTTTDHYRYTEDWRGDIPALKELIDLLTASDYCKSAGSDQTTPEYLSFMHLVFFDENENCFIVDVEENKLTISSSFSSQSSDEISYCSTDPKLVEHLINVIQKYGEPRIS